VKNPTSMVEPSTFQVDFSYMNVKYSTFKAGASTFKVDFSYAEVKN
jgi:hypothetical protein